MSGKWHKVLPEPKLGETRGHTDGLIEEYPKGPTNPQSQLFAKSAIKVMKKVFCLVKNTQRLHLMNNALPVKRGFLL